MLALEKQEITSLGMRYELIFSDSIDLEHLLSFLELIIASLIMVTAHIFKQILKECYPFLGFISIIGL